MTRIMMTAFALATIGTATFAMSDADGNGDKLLTMDEVKATYPEISEDQFNLADADKDGLLSEQEVTDAVEAGVLPATDG